MQKGGCGNNLEVIASSTLPAALLHLSDEEHVSSCNAWVLNTSFTLRQELPDGCPKPLKAKSNAKVYKLRLTPNL
jgi:hypothetical protein